MKQQKGFTLVEMAIVLVIIGLLLGGVLKGQELIESSRIKNAANDINGVIAAYNGYVDRFRAVPGDDLDALPARGAAWTGLTASKTGGNGVLDNTDAFDSTGEGELFWRHTRAAGFIAGNPATTGAAALPTNAFSGRIGVLGGAAFGLPAGSSKVCLNGVPGKAARALDIAMDNGLAVSGIFRGAITFTDTAAPTDEYVDESTYIVCRTM